jgi:low molecular weight protein-tyrosine phosphatase
MGAEIPPPGIVLFLCTGNYYRSRFAEHLFNARAPARGLAWRADSAGLELDCSTRNPGPISRMALQALNVRGIGVPAPHRPPRDVEHCDFETARLVIALKEAEHRPLLEARFAAFAPRVEYWHVDDVEDAPPEHALPILERKVDELLLRLG